MSRNLCRACLLEKKISELFDWYILMDKANEPLTYQECFQICTQVDVKKADATSSYVKDMHFLCHDCIQELITSYRFLRKAQRSAQELYALAQGHYNLTDNKINEFEYVNIQELVKNGDFMENSSLIDTGGDLKSGKELPILSYKHCSKNHGQPNNEDGPLGNSLLQLKEPTHQITQGLITSSLQEFALSKADRSFNSPECEEITLEKVENGHDAPFVSISDCLNEKDTTIIDNSKNKRVRKKNPKLNTRVKEVAQRNKPCLKYKEMPCEYCNKLFPENKLRQHKSRYHRPKIFLCDICPSSFSIANNLRRHQRTHDLNRQRNFSCNECGRKFFTEDVYRTHIKTHQSSRQSKFNCNQCDKVFLHKGSLTLHIQKHGEPKNECSVCMKRYVRKVDLEVHMRNHSGELPYQCPLCERAFMTTSALRKHELLHNGIRYKCGICNKEYSHPSKLSRHRLHHTGLPFKCAICDRGFAEPNKIRRHIRCVHKVEDDSQINKLTIKV
ncbi:zinc finger protein 600-like isoform X2 [Rhagoletis pomonella]|nr:zinc finger protein 600-like isoform X2 [Rhagoletis pomonella]